MTLFETGRGGVNAWECDENDHLNVQFYVARLTEATVGVAMALGLDPMGETCLVPVAHHLRFLRELRTADTTVTRSRIIEVRTDTIVTHHEVVSGGAVAASFLAVDGFCAGPRRPGEGPDQLSPWPAETVRTAELLRTDLPEAAAPRSVLLDATVAPVDLSSAIADGCVPIFRGQVQPFQCDRTGALTPQHIMGAHSTGVGHLWDALGLTRERMLDAGRGGIVLENRLNYFDPVAAGTPIIALSALLEVMSKRMLRFRHMMFDQTTGRPVAVSEVAVATLDFSTRRMGQFSDAELAELATHAKPQAGIRA